MNFIKNLKKKVYILPIVFVFILTSCISNTNFLPTQTFASSQIPTDSSTKEVTETPTSQIITQRPEDKFLFVEVWLRIEGVGKVPMVRIDKPSYKFNQVTKDLHLSREILLNKTDWGFIGQGSSIHGTAGGGRASGINIIENIPINNIEVIVPTGNINVSGSAELKVIEATLTSIYSDGTIILEIDNDTILLKPDESWSLVKEIVFSSNEYGGHLTITASIKNYGWLNISSLRP